MSAKPIASVIYLDPANGFGGCAIQRRGVGFWSRAKLQDDLYMWDVISCDENTEAAIEFVVGGRMVILGGRKIRIVGWRMAADAATGEYMELKEGTIWAKAQCQKPRLNIRPPSAVIGIRG
jgi:hypothetical protein